MSGMNDKIELITSKGSRRPSNFGARRIQKSLLAVVVFVCFPVAFTLVLKWTFRGLKVDLPPRIVRVNPIVETDCGKVEGKQLAEGIAEAFVFKGIPFSVPPIGERRWKPPKSLLETGSCWKGVLKALKFRSNCSQPDLETLTKVIGKEDCLYLNVWSPNLDETAKLPVMVWIHGGNLVGGTANLRGAIDVVNDMGIVLVSISYRLNAFGFMALDVLSQNSDTKTSGNYGFMDQILALKWVRRNIRNFGGDPEMVTVVGHSSGATSIYGLLASKKANGLFKRAIAMSGSPVFQATTKQASKDNEVFLKNSKCNKSTTKERLQCLYNLNQSQIIQSIPWFTYPSWAMRSINDLITKGKFVGAVCVVDGDVVFAPPGLLHTFPKFSLNASVLIGTTAQEIDFLPVKDFRNKPWSEFVKFLELRLGAFSKNLPGEALSSYKELFNSTAGQLFYTTIASDIRMTCPENILTSNFSMAKSLDVYRYVVTNRPSKPALWFMNHTSIYSAHAWDSSALFGYKRTPFCYKPSSRDLRFTETIRKEFLHFMKYGKPSMATWKEYPRNIGVFENEGIAVKDTYHEKQCKLWNQHNLFPYGWKN